MMNLLENANPEVLQERGLTWTHLPESWEALEGGGLRVKVPARLDYFQDPSGNHIKDNAPYLWTSVSGDFVARAKVRPPSTRSGGDAAAIMVRQDAQHWGKLCFEFTDLGNLAAVSVVTNGVSDDANGADLTPGEIWLQVCRAGDVFGLQYSLDGKNWRMVRVFKLVMADPIQLGLVAQCPGGPGTMIDWLSFTIEPRRVTNLRAGI
jgi:uncharacterized protein